MALSIAPTAAWDLTSATTPLATKLGTAITLTQTNGTLNTSGFTVASNNHFLSATAPSAICTTTVTLVVCATMASNVASFVNIAGLFNNDLSSWAAALQTWDNPGTVYVGRINGSVGGRYSTQSLVAVTEAVIVCTLGPSAAKIWYNGSLVLNGTTGTPTYGAANTLELFRVGTNSGSTLKYAALYDAEPSAADITALGSNATSAYSAIFDLASTSKFRPYFITG